MNKKDLKKSVQQAALEFNLAAPKYEKILHSAHKMYLEEMKRVLAVNNLNLITDEEVSFKLDEIVSDLHFTNPQDVAEVDVYSQILHEFS